MKPSEIAARRKFDFRILDGMRSDIFEFRAYKSYEDLQADRNRITKDSMAGLASKYNATLRIPTLIGPGTFSRKTVFGVDTDVADYPISQPFTWLISEPIPWSPHFAQGKPICIGQEFWLARAGYVTLGHLVIHIAMMLNWDEKGRGSGYQGWNREAIKYHADHYSGALNPSIQYPVLPDWLSGQQRPAQTFQIIEHKRSG
jgi:hypothetical protein